MSDDLVGASSYRRVAVVVVMVTGVLAIIALPSVAPPATPVSRFTAIAPPGAAPASQTHQLAKQVHLPPRRSQHHSNSSGAFCPTLRIPKGRWTTHYAPGWTPAQGMKPHPDLPETWSAGFYDTPCRYHTYSREEALKCVANKTILVSGESLIRDLLQQLLFEMYPQQEYWRQIPNVGHHFVSIGSTMFAFLWNPVPRLTNLDGADHMLAGRAPDNVLLGASLWDMKSPEGHISPQQHHDDQVRVLQGAKQKWPRSRMTYYMLTHITKPDACFTAERVAAVRGAVECALVDSGSGIPVLDLLHPTEDPVAHKKYYVPGEGVHPQGTLKQWAVQMWLNDLCGDVPGGAPVCGTRSNYDGLQACV